MSDVPAIEPEAAKARLRARLDDLAEAADASGESRRPVELDQTRVGRLSRMDAMQNQAMALEVERRRKRERRRIEAALGRIDNGDFGFCASCGEAIEGMRLDLDPAAPLCLSCTRRVGG